MDKSTIEMLTDIEFHITYIHGFMMIYKPNIMQSINH